ncbi:MAG: hypothetical protein ABSH22_20940 [Tepidisphaeraceae bacterium]|jgi:hypothetical protein
MQNAIVIKGRLVGPRSVELDEPIGGGAQDVEVIVRVSPDGVSSRTERVFDFLRRLPAGTRGREDIDHQIREEREAWGKEA